MYERVQQRFGKQMGLQSELDQSRVFCIVVMFLGLDAGVRQVLDFDLKSHLTANCLHQFSQLQNCELFGELIEDSEFTLVRWIQTCDLDTTHGVSNVQKSSRLASLSVHSQYMAQSRLCTKPVQNGS